MVKLGALCALIALSLAGCGIPYQATPSPGASPFTQVNELFRQDVHGGLVTFTTNNPLYWSENGYTLWATNGNVQSPFTSRSVELTKLNGDASGGYGFVFCQYDSGAAATGVVMLVAMIRTDGHYIVGKVVRGVFSALVPWTYSDKLTKGYNQKNTVSVTRAAGEFSLTINGYAMTTFRDDVAPECDHGDDGYVVVISNRDTFPDYPVRVTFKEL